jgi:plasmid replication initiation protein
MLKPDRYPQGDLFFCDIADAVLKDVMPTMEHPFYALSKRPDLHIREYHHNDNWIRIIPSVRGLATIYDKDILIYAISQIMAAVNRGEKVSKRIRINSHDFLKFTNRGVGGKDYTAFIESLERLGGTRITTNIRMPDGDQTDTFGLIDATSVKREFGIDGRIQWVEMKLSEWIFEAIMEKDVLTLHPDYFRLRKPLERRVYEIARKHVGQQKTFTIGIENLLNKSGSRSSKKKFKFVLQEISKTDHLPDYSLKIEGENVVFTNKGTMLPEEKPAFSGALPLKSYDAGRKAAPGWDIYQLEQEWRNWIADGKMDVKNPARHFEKFCASWFEKRGKP